MLLIVEQDDRVRLQKMALVGCLLCCGACQPAAQARCSAAAMQHDSAMLHGLMCCVCKRELAAMPYAHEQQVLAV
jgi:hypothetical protein